MADDPNVDPDQKLFDQIKDGKYDLTKPHRVGFRIDFDPSIARQTAADLILAGYSSVRLDMEGEPAVIVSDMMMVTLDSIRSMRAALNDFATPRDGEVVGLVVGGGMAVQHGRWTKDASGNATTDQADQMVIDEMFAFDADLKQLMTFGGGIGFADERSAREAAAALMIAGYPEVAVASADFGSVAVAVMYMAPALKAIRRVRLDLSKIAALRGGSWLGFHVTARAPV